MERCLESYFLGAARFKNKLSNHFLLVFNIQFQNHALSVKGLFVISNGQGILALRRHFTGSLFEISRDMRMVFRPLVLLPLHLIMLEMSV